MSEHTHWVLPTSPDELVWRTRILWMVPARRPMVAESLIEDVSVLQHFTVHWRPPIWEDGFSGYELTFESRISGTVTQSLLSHLRNEAITLWNCCWQTMRGLWLNDKPVLAAPTAAAAAGKTHKKWSCCLKPVLDNRYLGQSRLLFNY